MAAETVDVDSWMTVMAEVLELDLADDYRPGVANNLKTAAKMAAMLETVPLADEAEAAPVFRP